MTDAEMSKAPTKVAARFRQAEDIDAQKPFIGALVGEERPVTKKPGGVSGAKDIERYISGQAAERNLQRTAEQRARMESNIRSAQEVDRRAREYDTSRQQKADALASDLARHSIRGMSSASREEQAMNNAIFRRRFK